MARARDDLDLDVIRSELEERRDRTRERLAQLAKRPERGSALGFGKRIGDGTTEAVSRLTDIGVGDSLERVLARTERALAKLDDGSYGVCDSCGDPIPPGRCERYLTGCCASRARQLSAAPRLRAGDKAARALRASAPDESR
jgi:DnaK suppressor protein